MVKLEYTENGECRIELEGEIIDVLSEIGTCVVKAFDSIPDKQKRAQMFTMFNMTLLDIFFGGTNSPDESLKTKTKPGI